MSSEIAISEKNLRVDIASNGRLFESLIGGEKESIVRFQASAFRACRANPKLLEEPRRHALLMALGEAASLGLDPNPLLGECWLIPRKGKNGPSVDFQTGYKGLMKIARRSGDIRFHVDTVRYGDEFVWKSGTTPSLVHEPLLEGGEDHGSDSAILASYAVAWVGGDPNPVFRVVRRSKIEEARSLSGNPFEKNSWSDVWDKHFESMALKVAIARLCPLLPRVDDLTRVLAREESRQRGEDTGPLVEQLKDIVTAAQVQQETAGDPRVESALKLPMPGQGGDGE